MLTMTCVIDETSESAQRNSTSKRAVDQERARSSHVVVPRILAKETPSALLRDGSCCFDMIYGSAGYSSQVGVTSGQIISCVCPHTSARYSPQAKQASLERAGLAAAAKYSLDVSVALPFIFRLPIAPYCAANVYRSIATQLSPNFF